MILQLELMSGLLIKEIRRLFNFNVKQFFALFNICKRHVTNITARRRLLIIKVDLAVFLRSDLSCFSTSGVMQYLAV